MVAISLATAQAQLTLWVAASEAISKNQSYSINGRSLSRADAADVLKMIDYWEAKVDKLSRTRNRLRYVVPN